MRAPYSIALLFGMLTQAIGVPAHSLSVGESASNPIGFHDATPSFSWLLPASAKAQSAYHLETRSGEAHWDSGWVESDQSTFVPYEGEALSSRQQVEWRVNLRDENGCEGGWSSWARFELGLLSNQDWEARWIRPQQEVDMKREPVATLRHSFQISKPIEHARLYATAKGVFELHLNGKRVSVDHFANGFTSYRNRLDTLTYDVTGHLQPGSNTIVGLLGSGWYAGRLPFETTKIGPYGTDTGLLLQLEITYRDGSSQVVASGEQWEGTYEGPIVSSSLYDGEVYDARRQLTDWQPVAVEPDLGNARLTPKPFAPVRATETLSVQSISEPKPGSYVFDLGQNIVGWARIRVPVEQGETITIRFAEMLQADGTLYTANYRTAKSTDTYTAARSGVVDWEPHFTFHGFRYVKLSGRAATCARVFWARRIFPSRSTKRATQLSRRSYCSRRPIPRGSTPSIKGRPRCGNAGTATRMKTALVTRR
ncbi:MAG: alpha-L-rhamnosidase [Puniceicoccaceae bacterium 5H]|nr:MAG: alpha-L-rhamnosidase [Puniceicoccaceae bacterium 5H]